MKIQNARGEELSKGLYSDAEIPRIKLHAPFKLLEASYKPMEISSWLNIVNNRNVNFALQIQMCAIYLQLQFHLFLKTIIYLSTIVRVGTGVIL